MKQLCVMLIVVVFCGCAAPRMNTASGRPEVTINAPVAKVRSMLVSGLVDRDYVIQRTDEFVIEAERDAGTTATVFLANASNPTAQVRANLNLSGADGSARVILRTYLIASGQNQGETTGAMQRGQDWLDQIKNHCESGSAP